MVNSILILSLLKKDTYISPTEFVFVKTTLLNITYFGNL